MFKIFLSHIFYEVIKNVINNEINQRTGKKLVTEP